MSVRICVLETDILVPELAELYDGYGAMFVRLFEQVPEQVECTVYNVVEGHYPPDGARFDAYLVTGVMSRVTSSWASALVISCWPWR